jgi:hypothetical protein
LITEVTEVGALRAQRRRRTRRGREQKIGKERRKGEGGRGKYPPHRTRAGYPKANERSALESKFKIDRKVKIRTLEGEGCGTRDPSDLFRASGWGTLAARSFK